MTSTDKRKAFAPPIYRRWSETMTCAYIAPEPVSGGVFCSALARAQSSASAFFFFPTTGCLPDASNQKDFVPPLGIFDSGELRKKRSARLFRFFWKAGIAGFAVCSFLKLFALACFYLHLYP